MFRFRYSMTLCGGNPQALMLPAECLHHYAVTPEMRSDAPFGVPTRETPRWRRWLRLGAGLSR